MTLSPVASVMTPSSVGKVTIFSPVGLVPDKFIFNSLSDGIDIIKDYTFGQSDVIQVSKAGFGTTNIETLRMTL